MRSGRIESERLACDNDEYPRAYDDPNLVNPADDWTLRELMAAGLWIAGIVGVALVALILLALGRL